MESGIVCWQEHKNDSRQMTEYILNPTASVEKIHHEDPEIAVYVVDDFLANPEALLDYARTKAYFGKVGADRTAYPGVRDRLPSAYERALAQVIELVLGDSKPTIYRCMLSLTTLNEEQLHAAQKIPHVDAVNNEQYAAVHYLCDAPHGGTAIYRYLPRNMVRIRNSDRHVINEMIQTAHDHPEEHDGYLKGNTRFYRQELVVEAKFNRLVLYPGNLLHCALLTHQASLSADVAAGRLSVASFFTVNPHSPLAM